MALTYHYVTTTGAGAKDGAAWASAFDLAAFYTDFAAVAAGDVYFFAGGTYNLTADITTASDGTTVDPIAIIGVKSGTTNEGAAITSTDFPTGDDRPLFNDGGSGYYVWLDDCGRIENIRVTSYDTMGIRADGSSTIRNCKLTNNYTGATAKIGIYLGSSYELVINCEVTGAELSNGISPAASGNQMIFCYLHDIGEGEGIGNYTSQVVLFCILDNCLMGIESTADNGCTFFGNTIYDCDAGFTGTTCYANTFINNIFSDCATDALIQTTASVKTNRYMYNHFYNNGDDYDGVIADGDADDLFCDFWDTSGDPDFTTPGSNFSLQSSSPCINAGMSMILGVG